MADTAPEHVPSSASYEYSTLEAADTSTMHSTLEPAYQEQTYPSEQKEAYQKVNSHYEDGEGGHPVGGSMNRRLCGIRIKIAFMVAAILLLIVVGAVVGGVVGSRKKDNVSNYPTPTQPSTTSISSSKSTPISTTETSSAALAGPTGIIPQSMFSSRYWRTLTTSGSESDGDPTFYSLQASYDKDTLSGSPAVKQTLLNTSSTVAFQQWQFYTVPRDWANGTLYLPGGGDWGNVPATRTFWIANRNYGPDIRLTLDEERWAPLAQGKNTSVSFPFIRLRPKNLSDLGQYWFALKYVCGVEKRDCFKIHNVKSGTAFRIWANEEKGWGEPLMGTGVVAEGAWDLWDVKAVDEISPSDGGFEWVTG